MSDHPLSFASFKIDYTLPNNIPHIVDVGPYVSDNTGFPNTDLTGYEELSYKIQRTIADLLSKYTDYVPLIHLEGGLVESALLTELLNKQKDIRKKHQALFDLEDTTDLKKALSICTFGRCHDILNMMLVELGKQVYSEPPAFSIISRYKMFWYLLMQQHLTENVFLPMPVKNKIPCLLWFWGTDQNPTAVCEKINQEISIEINKNPRITPEDCYLGFHVKIANLQTGCGKGVHYVNNVSNLRALLASIKKNHDIKDKTREMHCQDLYIIEPSKVMKSPIDIGKKEYAGIGRAFIVLIYDYITKELCIKIVDNILLTSKTPLDRNIAFNDDNMIINLKNCLTTQGLLEIILHDKETFQELSSKKHFFSILDTLADRPLSSEKKKGIHDELGNQSFPISSEYFVTYLNEKKIIGSKQEGSQERIANKLKYPIIINHSGINDLLQDGLNTRYTEVFKKCFEMGELSTTNLYNQFPQYMRYIDPRNILYNILTYQQELKTQYPTLREYREQIMILLCTVWRYYIQQTMDILAKSKGQNMDSFSSISIAYSSSLRIYSKLIAWTEQKPDLKKRIFGSDPLYPSEWIDGCLKQERWRNEVITYLPNFASRMQVPIAYVCKYLNYSPQETIFKKEIKLPFQEENEGDQTILTIKVRPPKL